MSGDLRYHWRKLGAARSAADDVGNAKMLARWIRTICRTASALLTGSVALVTPSELAMAADPVEFGCEQPVRLAIYEFGPLYHDGRGSDMDIVAELAQRSGCLFETQLLPRAQIMADLQSGEIDVSTAGIATVPRRAFSYFIPYLGLKAAIVARADVAAAITDFDDLIAHPEWRIGVVKGIVNGAYFDYRLRTATSMAQMVLYPDQAALYRGLTNGEVQAIVSPSINYAFYLPTPEAEPTAYSMLFSHKSFSPKQIDAWTRLFEAMRLDGTLATIYQRHLPAPLAQGMMDF
jgi:polar amino acid transport system substrate-binding protein